MCDRYRYHMVTDSGREVFGNRLFALIDVAEDAGEGYTIWRLATGNVVADSDAEDDDWPSMDNCSGSWEGATLEGSGLECSEVIDQLDSSYFL